MGLAINLEEKKTEEVYVCSHCGHRQTKESTFTVYENNITHNLGEMATEAGIYYHLWRPEEIGITKAKQLIEPLKIGLRKMKDNPVHYKEFDSPNGWGLYIHFVPWIEKYLQACIDHPNSIIEVSR